jgi:hypothetical protein
MFQCSFYQFGYSYLWVFGGIPAFLYITPYTTYITAAQPYKISCAALVKSLALEGVE